MTSLLACVTHVSADPPPLFDSLGETRDIIVTSRMQNKTANIAMENLNLLLEGSAVTFFVVLEWLGQSHSAMLLLAQRHDKALRARTNTADPLSNSTSIQTSLRSLAAQRSKMRSSTDLSPGHETLCANGDPPN